MFNTALDELTDYPFDRLRALLDGLTPPAGMEPLVMSLGEPQHAPPELIAQTVATHANEWGKYPPVAGSADLLDAISDWLKRRYQLPDGMIDPSRHVCAVSGTREALYMAGDIAISRTKRGQTPAVLIPNPFYQVYVGATVMSGAEPVYMSATADTGFLPDFDAVDPAVLERTALAFLCSPANPQGMAADRAYLEHIVGLARKYDFVLAMDECYAEIYDSVAPTGIMEACAAMGGGLSNVLAFHSLSKRSSAPGLRSGFVAGDAKLIQLLKRLRNYGGATIPPPLAAAAAALWRDETHVDANRALYREKFDRADQIIGRRFGYYHPDGGFYLWLDVGDSEQATQTLWTDAGVKVIPGAYLARPGADGVNPGQRYIRIALVHDPETVADGLHRVVDALA